MSRKKDLRPKDAAKTILQGAIALAGVFDVLEALEEGSDLMPAAKGALKKTKRRRKALKKVMAEPSGIIDVADEVEPRKAGPGDTIGFCTTCSQPMLLKHYTAGAECERCLVGGCPRVRLV